MIFVTGATGQLGQLIVQHLVARMPATGAGRIAVCVRDPLRAAALEGRGIAVRQGSFDDAPDVLARSLAGASRLVLVSTDGPKSQRIVQHRNAVEAARQAGVEHIFYTGFLDADAASPSEFAQVHADTEAALAASGMPHTILRNGLYADFLPMTFGAALQDGVLRLPAGRGKVSYVSRNELAQAIAAATVAPRLEKHIYELTGQTAHDYEDLARRIGAATRKTIRYQPVTENEHAATLEAAGLPAWLARAMANMFNAAAGDRFARTTNDFAALVGHPPKSIDCLIAEFFRVA